MDVDLTSKEALDLFGSYIHDSDFIPRKSTASSTVIHGVKKDENPELTTLWTVLGYPPCSIAIPAWVKAGNDNPSLVLRYGEKYTSLICDMSLALKETVYNVNRGHGKEYLDFSKIFNKEGSGYMQQLKPIEDSIFETVNPLIDKWRKKGSVDVKEIKNLGTLICTFIEKSWPEFIN
jgi:hypothetical protein